MSVATSVRLSGSVVAGTSTPATLTGQVDGPSFQTLTGTVSRTVIDSYDGASVFHSIRVKLDGSWIPDDELMGPIEINENLRSPIALFSFGLSEHSPMASNETWTRTPVEIWVTRGELDNMQAEELLIAGFASKSNSQRDAGGTVVRVDCFDQAGYYADFVTCLEVEPHAGQTRGEIARTLLESAGITAHDVPDGAEWKKAFFTDGQALWKFLQPFIEPEGWRIRFDPAGTCVLWEPKIKRHPEPPDHEWGSGDWYSGSPDSVAPTDVPNRWVIRGMSAVEFVSAGQTVETNRIVMKDLYAPKVAVQEQQTDGSVTAHSGPAQSEALRTVRIIETSTVRQGSLILSKTTKEWAWFNPRRAQLRTPGAAEGDGTAPGGYHYVQTYIDEDGEYRQHELERFQQVGYRRVEMTYDANQDLTSSIERVWGWYARTAGARPTPVPSSSWVVDMNVGSDGETYSSTRPDTGETDLRQIDYWMQGEEYRRTFSYSSEGPLIKEQVDTYSYYSAQAALDVSGFYQTYNGSAQSDIVASFQKTHSRTKWNVLSSDGLLEGEIEREQAWAVPKRVGGTHDFGEFESERVSENFVTVGSTLTTYSIISEESFEKTVFKGDEPPTVEIILGRLPFTRYLSSAWTRLVQEPIELTWDDATLAAWFGYRKKVIQNDYIQDLGEAQDMLERYLDEELAFAHVVSRPWTMAEIGDTVRLTDSGATLDARALVTQRRLTFLPTGAVDAAYTLEAPLL